MFEGTSLSELSGALLPFCHAVGYVAIIGSVSAMAIKFIRCRTEHPDLGMLATAECKITLLCCTTFMLMGISIVVFFNSI
ncbi:hypothetical protein [Raoultibacter phocaeensis]|uniref:hypothetical protein n=1 Tax=Raoultibacter phocaeensis TaxID=2479841 RepID=UPI0011191CCA|nr:hypothetical protein [Raoultibacter phocaeensis]